MTKLGENIQVTIEKRSSGPTVVVYVDGTELTNLISASILDDPGSKFIPDNMIKLRIDCFAVLVEKVKE